MNIGIMGAPADNGNLGCMALTYSLLMQLEVASKKIGTEFHYYLFDGTNRQEKVNELAKNLNIPAQRIHNARPGFWVPKKPLQFLKSITQNIKLVLGIMHCDCVIDITAGDSFTDIYGQAVFDQRTNAKLLLKTFHKPLMLAPQTYGPFISQKNAEVAAKAIHYADVVLSRDEKSIKAVEELTGRKAILTNDLAFQLPYKRPNENQSDKIKIGINVSGLLAAKKTEKTQTSFELKADYDQFTENLCAFFDAHSEYDVYLISHVGDDYGVHSRIKERHPQMTLVECFNNPIEAKSFISGMDVFIGARMHGTIGAFTSGVACIPVAYSRKFSGLFETLGYYRTVDLQLNDTDESTKMVIDYVKNYKELAKEVKVCMQEVEQRNAVFNETLVKWIKTVNKMVESGSKK